PRRCREGVRHHREATVRTLAEAFDDSLDIFGAVNGRRHRLHAKRPRRGFERRQIVGIIGRGLRIVDERGARKPGRDLFEELDPFAAHRRLDIDESRDVALRARQTYPLPTGSETTTKMIGMLLVSRASAAVPGVVCPTIRSGCELTSSFARLCMRS